MNESGLSYKIGVVGPTRVGKTSLITSLLRDGKRLLRGTVVEIKPVGSATEARLARNAAELRGSLDAGEFRSNALRGTEEMFTFHLLLDPGVPDAGIQLEILDYPGGWMDAERPRPEREAQWNSCLDFMRKSTVLLIPIDAAVLMEASEGGQRHAVPHILMTEVVEWAAESWAKSRAWERPEEPALLLLCPVKCESYFADNGGRRDMGEDLLRRVGELYGDIIKAVRENAAHAKIWFCPVDTIGCVEVTSVDWAPDGNAPGGFNFTASYRVRPPKQMSIKGIDDVFTLLCAQLVEARRLAEAQAADYERRQAQRASEYAERSEGWLLDIWNWVSGEREDRRQAAREAGLSADRAAAREAALEAAVDRLAARDLSPRAHQL